MSRQQYVYANNALDLELLASVPGTVPSLTALRQIYQSGLYRLRKENPEVKHRVPQVNQLDCSYTDRRRTSLENHFLDDPILVDLSVDGSNTKLKMMVPTPVVTDDARWDVSYVLLSPDNRKAFFLLSASELPYKLAPIHCIDTTRCLEGLNYRNPSLHKRIGGYDLRVVNAPRFQEYMGKPGANESAEKYGYAVLGLPRRGGMSHFKRLFPFIKEQGVVNGTFSFLKFDKRRTKERRKLYNTFEGTFKGGSVGIAAFALIYLIGSGVESLVTDSTFMESLKSTHMTKMMLAFSGLFMPLLDEVIRMGNVYNANQSLFDILVSKVKKSKKLAVTPSLDIN